jgi:hypothetical protein
MGDKNWEGRKEAQGLLKRQTKEEEKKLWQAEKGQKAKA